MKTPQIPAMLGMTRLTIVREPPMWPTYREQFVVLQGVSEVGRFYREREAIEFRNAGNAHLNGELQ